MSRQEDSNPRHGRTREPDFEHATRAMRQRWLAHSAGRFMGIVRMLLGRIPRTVCMLGVLPLPVAPVLEGI